MKIFSDRLRATRLNRKITQTEIAALLNITQQSYNRYENNKGEPNLQTLIQLCKILDEDVEYLLGMHE